MKKIIILIICLVFLANNVISKRSWGRYGNTGYNRNGYKTFKYNKKYDKLVHRHVYEKYNGYIPKGYEIHHINHNKLDNRPHNLQMMSRREHMNHHKKYR